MMNSKVINFMSKLIFILENNNLASEEILKEYDEICQNYHENILEDLDNSIVIDEGSYNV